MKKELISIIVPLYNFEKYITKCLDSLNNQTYKNYEVIIVDDGSKDNSSFVVEEYIKKNNIKNFNLIKQKNGGVSSARNTGIKNAKGKWVAFVDADDFIGENFLKSLYDKSTNADFIVVNYNLYYDNKIIKNDKFPDYDPDIKENIIFNILNEKQINKLGKFRYNSMRNVWGKLYKRQIIENNNILFHTKLKHFEDGLFNLQYLQFAESIAISNDNEYFYYLDSVNSATKKFRKNILEEDQIKICETKKILDKLDYQYIDIFFNIFKFDLFSSYLVNYLFHKENKSSIIKKNKELKKLLGTDLYQCFNKDISSFLSKEKKIIYSLLKKKFTLLVCIILLVRRLVKGG